MEAARSSRCGPVTSAGGIILPIGKWPDLLDFPTIARK
jgi:hypothetical protein